MTEASRISALAAYQDERARQSPENLSASVRSANFSKRNFCRRWGRELLFGDDIGVFNSDVGEVIDELRNGEVSFFIASRGGNADTALYFYDQFYGRVTKATIFEKCHSSAVILAMAAEKIEIERSATMMLHPVRLAVYGSRLELLHQAERLTSYEDRFVKIISQRTNQNEGTVRDWLSGPDRYFSSEECVKLGLADSIFDEPKTSAASQPARIQSDLDRVCGALQALGPIKCDRVALARELNHWMNAVAQKPASGLEFP